MTPHVTLWLNEKRERKKKIVWFLDQGREDYSDLLKHAFVFVTL